MGVLRMVGTERGDQSAESHARCPHCEYDLTGLPEPRCPECGLRFSWDDLPQLWNRPTIAFEKTSGWRRLVAFVQTAATVLLAPWIFARQCVQRMDWRDGLLFGACCFATTPAALLTGADFQFLIVWFATGAIYVLAQACVLSVLDWPHWRDGAASWQFWLGIGCYTSAIVMTELVHGPPLIELGSILDVFRGGGGGWISMPSEPLVHWTQMAVWLAGLICVYAARLRARGEAWAGVIAGGVALTIVTYVMYAVAIQYLGTAIYEWLR